MHTRAYDGGIKGIFWHRVILPNDQAALYPLGNGLRYAHRDIYTTTASGLWVPNLENTGLVPEQADDGIGT